MYGKIIPFHFQEVAVNITDVRSVANDIDIEDHQAVYLDNPADNTFLVNIEDIPIEDDGRKQEQVNNVSMPNGCYMTLFCTLNHIDITLA